MFELRVLYGPAITSEPMMLAGFLESPLLCHSTVYLMCALLNKLDGDCFIFIKRQVFGMTTLG